VKRHAVRTPAVPDPPSWLAEIDPRPAPPFLAMGTRGLGRGRWLTIGDTRQLALKTTLLRAHRDQTTAALPDTEAAVRELADAVAADVAAATGTDVSAIAAAARVDAPNALGVHASVPAGMVEAAARLVAEDLCLLVPREGGWVLGAACVCFPSHWRLSDKLGRPVAAIHAPVPHYADELAGRVDRFLDRLAPGQGAWRRNWLVHTDDRLFAPAPPPPPAPALTADDAGERLWLRSERQTLRRLPVTGSIVFTIRTQQAPLAVVGSRPDLRAAMADAVESWSDDLIAYRGGHALRTPLLAWLRRPA